MQVQFVGLPASGKSTIVQALIAEYPDYYVMAVKKYSSITKLCLFKPGLTLLVFTKMLPILPCCIKSVLKSDVKARSKVLALFGLVLNLANYLELSKTAQQEKKIILWDELLYQRALSIFAYSEEIPDNDELIVYAKWADKTCLTTIIDVQNKVKVMERLYTRGLPIRLQEVNKKKLGKIIKTHQYTLDSLMSISLTNHTVNSDDSLKYCVNDIHSYFIAAGEFND